jgi:transposase
MESSCVWYGIYEYLTKNKHLNQVSLSNPIKTKAIASAKIKTDKIDAVQLASLLRGGYIADCCVPEIEIIRLREIVRHRSTLVRLSKMKNKIHGIMLMRGIKILDHHPFSIKYKQKLNQLHDYRINTYLRLIENIELEIKEVSRNIILLAKKDKSNKITYDNSPSRILFCSTHNK